MGDWEKEVAKEVREIVVGPQDRQSNRRPISALSHRAPWCHLLSIIKGQERTATKKINTHQVYVSTMSHRIG